MGSGFDGIISTAIDWSTKPYADIEKSDSDEFVKLPNDVVEYKSDSSCDRSVKRIEKFNEFKIQLLKSTYIWK